MTPAPKPVFRRGLLGLLALAGAVIWLLVAAADDPSTPDPAALVVLVPPDLVRHDVSPSLSLLNEPAATPLRADAVAALPDARFAPLTGSNLGIREHAVWLRLRLYRTEQSPEQLVLQLGRPVWRQVQAYVVWEGEDRHAVRLPALHSRHPAFAVEPPQGPSTLLVRVAQIGAITPQMQLWEAGAFRHHAVDDALLQGLFYGMMLALLIYNAFLYASTRDAAYLTYILWQAATLFYMLVFTGVGQHQLWNTSVRWNGIGLISGLMLMCAGGLAFIRTYLLLPRHAPRADLALQIVQWLTLTLALAALLPNSDWMLIPAQLLAAATLLAIAAAAVLRWRQQFVPAVILLLSLVPLLLVGFANIGRTLGWLPETFLTADALQWVSALLALVLTYGLSVRVAQLRERASRLQDLLRKDPLTGLLNRNGLFEQGQRLLDRTHDSQAHAAVLWLDLDGLKRINDQFGHAAGDALIQAAAARLRDAFGPDAACARLGGDEFAIILPNLPSPRLAEDLARHALERLRMPYALSGQEFHATGSIGVALYPQQAQNLEDLLRLADAAMYRAKAQGRDTYVLWSKQTPPPASAVRFTWPGAAQV